MEGTLALWFDPLDIGAAAPRLELHVNLWRDLSADFNFIHVGFRLTDLENLRRIHLFFPVPVRLASLSDLADTLRYGDTLKAVFNDLVVAGTGDARSYVTELDDKPHLTVHRLDLARDLSFEVVATPPFDGTILTFGEELCGRLRAAGGGGQYLRLRIHLDGRSRDLFSRDIASGDWRLATATGITEITEFRFNERRSYPEAVARRARDGAFDIERVHYFLIRDIEHQLTNQHRQLRNVRKLEGALWTPYLQGEPTSSGAWRAPAKVVERLAIYHWSAEAKRSEGEGPIIYVKAFTAFASFRAARSHLGIYAVAIVLLGAMGSLVASYLAGRTRGAAPEQLHADLAAMASVALLLLAYWLVVAFPWRRASARLKALARRAGGWTASRLGIGTER